MKRFAIQLLALAILLTACAPVPAQPTILVGNETTIIGPGRTGQWENLIIQNQSQKTLIIDPEALALPIATIPELTGKYENGCPAHLVIVDPEAHREDVVLNDKLQAPASHSFAVTAALFATCYMAKKADATKMEAEGFGILVASQLADIDLSLYIHAMEHFHNPLVIIAPEESEEAWRHMFEELPNNFPINIEG